MLKQPFNVKMSLRENQFTSQTESRICIFFTGISERPRSQSILPTKTNEIFFRYSRKKAFEKKKKLVFRLKVAFKSNSHKSYQGIFTNIDIKSSAPSCSLKSILMNVPLSVLLPHNSSKLHSLKAGVF